MILLHRYYVMYIVWLCLFYLLKEISSELAKPNHSLPFEDVVGAAKEEVVEERWNPSPRVHQFSNNFTHYSRGRLKEATTPIKNALPRNSAEFDKRDSNNAITNTKNLLDTLIHRLSDISNSDISNSNSLNSTQTNYRVDSSSNFNGKFRYFNVKTIINDSLIASPPRTSSAVNSIQREQLVKEKKYESSRRRSSMEGDFVPPSPLPPPPSGAATEFARHRVITPTLFHSRTKRGISDTWQSDSHVHHLTLGLNLGERDILLDLYLNRDLLSGNYFEKVLKNGSQTFQRRKENKGMCHYQGFIKDVPGSWAAVSTCSGIRGIVFDGEDTHYLEPIPGLTFSPTDPHYHLNHRDLHPTNLTCGYMGRPNHPVRELFHDETFKRLLRYKRETSESSIRGPFNANSLSRYVELVLVADKTEYEKHDSDVNKIYDRCKAIANIVNALYQPLNIFIALVGVEVWQEEDPVEIFTDGDKTLTTFLNYRKIRLIPEHPNDNAQLLTGKVFDSGVVGKALKGPICTYQYSGGVNMDHSDSVGLVATTVAHEMGHNFGMEHDTEEDCKCPDKRCIMAPSSGSTKSPSHWSSCSHEYLAISFERSMDYCLRNKPTSLFDSPVCGNGFVEAGEQCDCGLEEHCNNPCCNSTTCMLFSNATCATGHCCDLQTCRPRPAGMECRPALHECDLPEYCSGDSEYCPDNFYKEDGYGCLGGKAYCYEGMCRTHEHQCRLLWGPTGKNSDDKCYNLNKEGNTHGNCGYNWTHNTYKKCTNIDVKCGMMHCKHFNERLEFGMESVSKVSHRFIADKKQGVIPCRVAQVDLGLDMVDPGLAPDGAKCGYNKMCVGQHCMEVAALRKHVCDCNRNGVCNNLGNCHCKIGYAWPDCKYPGLGGSSDSGPASNPNARSQFVVGMFVFFLGIVPLTVIVLCLIYYVKGNLKIWLMRKGRPMTSRLSGMEGRRGSALRVEIVTKSTTDASADGVPSGVRSPSPPSSQGSKSNSPLLNGHANGASNNLTQFFGKHGGYTLSPIKEKPKVGDIPPESAPSAPPLTEVISSSVTSPSAGRPTCKVKPYSQNLWPPNSGGKPNVDIGSPSLQTSTNPAVKPAAPLTSATVPTRHAPQRPKSVPDASTLILENIPASIDVHKDQGKQSTVARIASFLSKKERAESAPPGDIPKCNTLPRKAAKINRESLLQLEISHPMQLQATELPSNLVPVRPAPDPPMPSNLKPSEIKANQDKGSINKVTWAPTIGGPEVDEKKNDHPRVGSVKEHSVTTRPPIPKFGSMRAPRPKSLPPPRPSQPPPRPPLPMIPGTPETEYFYDDCITVQINAPLAPEEDGTSPPQEGIYATIDEDSPTKDPTVDITETKKDKKSLFSMLYAKTKKKKNAEIDEPLYCNIESAQHTEQDKSSAREISSNTPSPVIADRISNGSADEGGLLSEIVTELVTREPQYMNTLSKKSKGSCSPKQDSTEKAETSVPSEKNSRQNSIQSSTSLSPKSKETTLTDVEKPKPYVPYSSLKPRGVFNFFGKSNSEEAKPVTKSPSPPHGIPISEKVPTVAPTTEKQTQEPESSKKPEYQNKTLAASLAEVKAISAAAKLSVLHDKSSVPDPSSQMDVQTESNANLHVSESQDIQTESNNDDTTVLTPESNTTTTTRVPSSKPKSQSVTANITSTRSRPVFPPDKILHSTDKSGLKSGMNAGTKKIPGINNDSKPTKGKVAQSTTSGASGILGKPSSAKSVGKLISKPATTGKQTAIDKEVSSKISSGNKKPQNPSVPSKPETKPKGIIKERDSSVSKTNAESKPATAKKSTRVTSPTTAKSPLSASSKSSVLAAAAKSGPQGTSHVASLQQKFEKESQGPKLPIKVAAKKSMTQKGSSK